MPAVWRIRDRMTFVELRKRGRRGRSGPVAVAWLKGELDQPPAVGYAIGRSLGGAVVRNRIRRRLRAVVTGLPLLPGAYLITVTPSAVSLTSGELQTVLTEAVDRATLRDAHPPSARRS